MAFVIGPVMISPVTIPSVVVMSGSLHGDACRVGLAPSRNLLTSNTVALGVTCHPKKVL